MSDEPRFRRRDDVAWVDRPERVTALALSGALGQPVALEGSAALLWAWLEEPHTLSQLVDKAIGAGAPVGDATRTEVEDFVVTLERERLVSREV